MCNGNCKCSEGDKAPEGLFNDSNLHWTTGEGRAIFSIGICIGIILSQIVIRLVG
jgi:hypothetical protein